MICAIKRPFVVTLCRVVTTACGAPISGAGRRSQRELKARMTSQRDSDGNARDPQDSTIANTAASVPRGAVPDDDAPAIFNLAILGASAGGVDALSRVVANTPADAGYATVVLAHLDAHHE